MRLNQLSDNAGAHKARKRVGRGTGSGVGGTAGRGNKGQKSRSGVSIKGFEGGQMPLYRRVPKRGFTNIFRKNLVAINVGRLQQAVDAKKLDAGKPVDADALLAAGVIRRKRDGVKLLANGELTANLTIEVTGASKAAVAAVEKAGGKVAIVALATAKGAETKSKPKAEAKSKGESKSKDEAKPKGGAESKKEAKPKEKAKPKDEAKPKDAAATETQTDESTDEGDNGDAG